METKHELYYPESLYYVRYAVVNWIDVFVRYEYRNLLIDCLKHCQKSQALNIYSWCIMTSYLHMIIGSKFYQPDKIMRYMKKHTTGEFEKAIKEHPEEGRSEWMLCMMEKENRTNDRERKFRFWQKPNESVEIDTYENMEYHINIIHNTPVKTGFVQRPEEYLYSSAIDYVGGKGLLDIKVLVSE